MNMKINTLFFVYLEDTISKIKTIKQDYHRNELHLEKPKQLHIKDKKLSLIFL